MTKKKKKEHNRGPVSTLLILTFLIGCFSFLFSFLGWESYQTSIANGTLESSLITVNNFFSLDGIRFFFQNAVQNFRLFEPLVLLIIVLIGIGICERSGFIDALLVPFKKIRYEILIFFTLLLGIVSTIIGDYSYILLIPLTGVVYKSLGKNPTVGILTCFLGITLGYGTGVIYNYNDYLLGSFTQISATLDVDKTFVFQLDSSMIIMIATSLVLAFVGTILVTRLLVPKFPKRYQVAEEEIVLSKKARNLTFLCLTGLLLVLIYLILPLNAPGAGILLDTSQTSYIAKIFGANAPFQNGFVLIITLFMMVAGFLYGQLSGNIKNSNEYSLGLSKNFENLGFMFVLMFFASQMLAILDWTNLGNVVGARIVDFLSHVQFSGILLIVTFFIAVLLMSFLLPGTFEKWNLLYPTIIPLFMRANIAPEFTLFIFKIADGVGKALTPMFLYFIITLAFLEKYRTSEKAQVGVFGIWKTILPCVLSMGFVLLLLIVLWYLMGLPIGMGIFPTL